MSCCCVLMYVEISIFRVHNVKRVCGQLFMSCSVNKGRVVKVLCSDQVMVPSHWISLQAFHTSITHTYAVGSFNK